MNSGNVRRDMAVLAGELPHRGACTRHERTAAEYLQDRLSASTPDVEIDDFHAMDSPLLMFGSYYAEFLLVAILAIWWPWAGFGYGLTVFLMYFLELSGVPLVARLLAQYETQNVIARFIAPRPRRLAVVVANCDSPRETFVEHPSSRNRIRSAHLLIVTCMLMVLVTCVATAYGLFDSGVRFDLILRWSAAGILLCAASALMVAELTADYAPGANDNASGLTTLLALAEALEDVPLEETDVWLVVTGARRGWFGGMRRLLATQKFDKETTYFLDLRAVGQGPLRAVSSEGIMHAFASDPALVAAAQQAGKPWGVEAVDWPGLPGDTYLPRVRGYRCLGITAFDAGEAESDLDEETEVRVDPANIAKALAFTTAILRSMDQPESEKHDLR